MKNGFTMTEMVGTVVILCVIALIVFPLTLNLIKTTDSELSNKNKELVITATNTYVSRNVNNYPKTINNVYYVSIEDLIKDNLLSNTLIENSDLKLDSCVKVTVNNESKYDYNVEINCSQEEG